MSHAGKFFLKLVARRLSADCEAKGLLPEEQCGFRPDRSTTDMMFVVRRLRELGRKAGVSLFMCFIDLQKACDTVDRTLLLFVVVVVAHIQRIGCQPEKTTLHGGQSRSWPAEQGKENKIKSLAAHPPPPPPPTLLVGRK